MASIKLLKINTNRHNLSANRPIALRRRGIAIFLFLTGWAFGASPVTMEHRLAELRKSPSELYAFLYKMPKGADLHNHLAGAVYAENFIEAAIEQHLCVDKTALSLVQCTPGLVDAAATRTDNTLRNALIDSLSMRNFVPGKQSAEDHFFDTFNKFLAVNTADLVAEIAQRAADQNESYVELMALDGGSAAALGQVAGLTDDLEATRKKLETAGLAKQVAALTARVDRMEQTRMTKLGCRQNPDSAACRLRVGYVYQVLREFPKEQVFAQVIAGFAIAAADPRVVAVNLVQPEDGYNSMHDYHLHMKMVDYAKGVYPNVHITLHAGELALGLVPPDGLRFHIREAVELGHAERIGHGVDVMYDKDPAGLLKEMRDRHVDVEINLTSNDLILDVKGDRHPLPVYRKYGVPVTLSTDDEGVSRAQLTNEFERAVLTYNLTYADLKEMVRNSIEYSFAPGASYWKDRKYVTIVAACVSGNKTPRCREYLEKNEKARLEADLEDRFAAFERGSN
jgi:adenosine deaminase